ncbi:MAG: c-type cytochrome [Chloroflexi bacterium]|nr:c-type cytochrome [Chloroflexota bacterium]
MKALSIALVQPLGAALRGCRRAWVLTLVLVSVSTVMGCSRGAYPLDFFSEMHYNQSHKIQEPPSLSAPGDSVPVTGRELAYTLVEARGLENPVAADDASIARGASLYQVNCAVCHGAGAKGDGPMRERLTVAGYGGRPADLTATGPTKNKADGEVYLTMSKGFAATYGLPAANFVMPGFEKLLTPEGRWAIINYLRTLE